MFDGAGFTSTPALFRKGHRMQNRCRMPNRSSHAARAMPAPTAAAFRKCSPVRSALSCSTTPAPRHIDFLAGCSSLNYGHNDPDMKAALVEHVAGDGIAHGLDYHTDVKGDFLRAFETHIPQAARHDAQAHVHRTDRRQCRRGGNEDRAQGDGPHQHHRLHQRFPWRDHGCTRRDRQRLPPWRRRHGHLRSYTAAL